MINILVSGASGVVGYGILRSLRSSGLKLNLIGTTIYDDSIAQAFCDVFEKAPPTISEEYIPWLLRMIEKHKIALLFPGIEADMHTWNEFKNVLEKSGAKIVANTQSLVNLCKDKWLFYQELKNKGSNYAIPSSLSADFEELKKNFDLPFLIKPRKGFASKGIARVYNQTDFAVHQDNIGSVLMVQPIVGNDLEEFTTSAFCDGRGGVYCYMTLKRRLSKEGFTEKAEVVELEGIGKALRNLCQYFKPVGPTNFQFRLHDGQLKLLEINPRISSSTSIRSLFGYNESAMAVAYYLQGIEPHQPVVRKGRAVRFIEDYIFYA